MGVNDTYPQSDVVQESPSQKGNGSGLLSHSVPQWLI
jgi:hypothetical protein